MLYDLHSSDWRSFNQRINITKTNLLPDELKNLIEICEKMWTLYETIVTRGPENASFRLMSEFVYLFHTLYTEYLTIMRSSELLDNKQIEEIKKDLHKLTNSFFTKTGEHQNPLTIGVGMVEPKQVYMRFLSLASEAGSFVYSRIYLALKHAVASSLAEIYGKFLVNSANRAGIFETKEKKSESISLSDLGVEEKPKKRGRKKKEELNEEIISLE